MELINLETFAKGAFAEKFRNALAEVMQNIQDPNTDENKVRSLTMKLSFKPSSRDFVNVSIEPKVTLAPVSATKTSLMLGVDGTGEIVVSEYKNQIDGQIEIPIDTEKPAGDNVLDLRKASSK